MASEDRILSVSRMADSLIEAGHTGMPNHGAILEYHVITTCEQINNNTKNKKHILQPIVTPMYS